MSKKINRPINPKTGEEYTRSYTWKKRHPEKYEIIKIKNRSPEQLFKSSIRTIKNKEHLKKVKLKYYHDNKEKISNRRKMKYNKEKAHTYYISKRNYKIGTCCEICGNSKEILERHHWNYNKPLLINTLCNTCHKIQHINNFDRWNKAKIEADKQLMEVNI